MYRSSDVTHLSKLQGCFSGKNSLLTLFVAAGDLTSFTDVSSTTVVYREKALWATGGFVIALLRVATVTNQQQG